MARPRLVMRRSLSSASKLLQQAIAVGQGARLGRIDEGERLGLAQAVRRQAQQQSREIGAQYLGLGELGARLEILLRIKTHAEPRSDAAAAALALVGARARHGLDGQPLQTIARAIAADAREPGVDHGADPGHRDGSLRDIGREHDSLMRPALEDFALLLPR